MAYTFDEKIVSDLHKDAYGYRPTQGWWDSWNYQDNDGKQAAWNTLLDDLKTSMNEEAAAEQRALDSFITQVNKTIALGANDEETAIRWILEGEDFSEYDYTYGASYAAYHFGLSYSNPFKEIFDKVMKSALTSR